MRPLPFSMLMLAGAATLGAETIWVEGEDAGSSKVARHPWYHDQVKKGELSGGEFISHFSKEFPGMARYEFKVDAAGRFALWIRANPVQSVIRYELDGGEGVTVDMNHRQKGSANIAADDKPDLRFVAWAHAGECELAPGKHTITFRFESPNENHGSLDCFVFAPPSFEPSGLLKPGEIEARRDELARENQGWVPWTPGRDAFGESAIDLRHLNERFAGEKGGIGRKGADFIHRKTGEVVRFWGVNGPPAELHGEELARCARMLAKRGVNLVRLHGAVFDGKTGKLDPTKIAHIQEVVAAMKKEGIYSHLSVYFPLWMNPEAGPGWREGYDGKKHPFALLYFEPEFQKLYRGWLKALLETPGEKGATLAGEPAVMGLELVNEDSFFFWTFNEENVPAPQLAKLEERFAKWAAARHGSVEGALAAWGGLKHPRDGRGRLGFRPLYQVFTDKTPRDQDTAAFLLETQRGFYHETTGWLRSIGYQGLVTASNWHTASSEVFGPLEKYSYTPGDFIDRHGYFGCHHQGDNAAWSIRDGHTYGDRSALRFDPEKPGDAPDYSHPAADPCYNGMPSMISETTWNRPNRHRGEAPLFYAAYGALQGSDAIVHFALDSGDWAVKPGYFMQPWTLMSPTQAGQFPAAALIFRQGLVREGEVLADFTLNLDDAVALKGSPLVQRANLDELRKADVGGEDRPRSIAGGVDPLVHFAGRSSLTIGESESGGRTGDLAGLIDRKGRQVTSSNGDLKLDYGKGLLQLRAPAAQGALGDLKSGGTIVLPDLEITSPMEIGEVVVVALDGKPIATSRRMLLQVMSEEKASGFETEPAGQGVKRITSIGTDPWLVREFRGEVRLKRADADRLKVTPLDANGMPAEKAGSAGRIELRPGAVYYLIEGS
ncbi:hypothetical protein [Luteolibacter marinus]|uniref:hypothetical protein n=1 Tax=Luteolibacter marinus TaxID=2776705 RepID=UPI0018679D93|nr:hypothetical protein [Luteolibacter marinus]